MSKGTPNRTIRVSDTIWTAAAAVADRQGVTMSDVIRRLLQEYAATVSAA